MRKLGTIILLPFLLSGCYGDIQIYLEPGRNASINADSGEVVFYMFSHVYRPAKGLLALPDGGKPLVLYKNIALYQFNTKTKGLKKIFDFGPLNPSRDSWNTIACYIDDSIVFKLTPMLGWETELKYPSRGIDSAIYKNYKDWFIYYPLLDKIQRVEETGISILPKSEIPYHELTGLISHIPMMEWGINLDALHPQSKRKRINELVELKGNQLYRNAIIELLADDFNQKDIESIITDMKQFVDSKKGYSRAKLLNVRDTTIEKLESIRRNNSRD